MLSVRQNDLIKILIEADEIVTADKLSRQIGVSTRTIRNDIHKINDLFSETFIEIKVGKGFYVDADKANQISIMEVEQNTDIRFEILTRIIDQENVDYFELADEFFISEPTLDRIIKELNQVIIDRDPTLYIYRERNQLMIDGNEEQKRKIFNLFLNQEIENNKLSLEKYANYFEYCDLSKLSNLILVYHKKNNFNMNDFFIISFILHVAVLIERISKGSYLQIENERDNTNSPEIKMLAKNLANEIETKLQVMIPEQELGYLERLYSGRVMTKEESKVSQINKVVNEVLTMIDSSYGIDFSLDNKLKGYLINHLSALYVRAAQRQYLMNPLTEELKNQFPFIYTISVYASSIIQERLAIDFPDEEIAYITLHFLSASETINFRRKRTILLISPYGIAGQRLARKKLERISSYLVEVISTTAFHGWNELPLDEVSLIVTSEYLPKVSGINVFKFDSILKDTDISQIEVLLNQNRKEENVVQQFFKKELFFPHQTFKKKEEVIHFLCEQLVEYGYCDESYVGKVLERDTLSSTAFGNYYALPHAIKRAATKNSVAVCCLDKPIDWGGKRVKLVLLIAMKEERDHSFEALFEQLVTILSDLAFVKKLAKQDSFEAFIRLCEFIT
ncbi:hypothetical protein A5881_000414 [Enterococcus termitis]